VTSSLVEWSISSLFTSI